MPIDNPSVVRRVDQSYKGRLLLLNDRTESTREAMSGAKQDAYHKIHLAPASKPSSCPIDHDFTPFNADYLENPYPQLERFSQEQPIFYSEQLGYLVLTRHQDILEVFKNSAVFSSENVQDPVFPVCPKAAEILAVDDYNPVAVMSNRQQPDHTRIRKFTREGFSSRRMKMLEPYIRECSDELLDQMLKNGSPAEFVGSFGHPLPGQVIFRFIGFPQHDYDELVGWTGNRLAFTWGKPAEHEQVAIAGNMLRYWRYCRDFVASRNAQPEDDLTSELLAAHKANPEELSYREVESIIYGISFAGHEIVSNFIALTLLNVLPNREQWRALCQDASLIPNALEEVLRCDSPQTSWRRIATRDTRIGGIDIPAGTQIFLSLGAANHEEDLFSEPADFDIYRRNASRHISFGHGIHFCLGARLARTEGQIAIEALTKRIPDLRLVENQSLQFAPNITFRGPRELYVEWG
ncbi:MAG: cytochrome P450 [Proteobacteria bacterium]|nr:cytochrome P450 [Pseudomonadota bacterium]